MAKRKSKYWHKFHTSTYTYFVVRESEFAWVCVSARGGRTWSSGMEWNGMGVGFPENVFACIHTPGELKRDALYVNCDADDGGV